MLADDGEDACVKHVIRGKLEDGVIVEDKIGAYVVMDGAEQRNGNGVRNRADNGESRRDRRRKDNGEGVRQSRVKWN